MAWKSRVVYFKVVPPDHPVSYGSTWESDRPVRVVTVPVGYGDGYCRSMSNRAGVIMNGRRYPQVGAICMDQMMVNIERDSAHNGDEVVLLGQGGSPHEMKKGGASPRRAGRKSRPSPTVPKKRGAL